MKRRRGLSASLFFVLFLALGCADDKGRGDFEKGESLREKGLYREALVPYRTLVLHNEEGQLAPEALYRIGEINYLFLDDYEAAIEAFSTLIRRYPWSERCRVVQGHLADIYMNKLQDYKQAVVEYQKAMAYYGAGEEAERFQYNIATAYFNMKNFEQQRIELNHLITRFPETKMKGDVLFQIANSYYVEGKLDKAIKTHEEIAATFPDNPISVESRFQIAVCLEEKEDLEGAIEALRQIQRVYANPRIIDSRIERITKRLKKRRR